MAISYQFNPFTGNFDEISQVTLANVGSSPNAQAATISNQVLTLQPADATNPGVITASAQTLGGIKTFNAAIYAAAGVDVAATGGTDTLSIGTANADVINIGRSGITINIQGTTLYENVSQLQVTDPLITINKGGGAGSGANSGLEIEEASSITAYIETSSDRNSWILKAPNTAGVVTITPGASGFVIDQASHNPVTLTTVGSSPNANGASLSGQQLQLQPADGTNPGVLTAIAQTIGGVKTISSAPIFSSVTASQVLAVDGSKQLTSLAYASANTANALVQRDSSGNFNAGSLGVTSINASTSLNAGTVATATGQLTLSGLTSGTVIIKPQDAAGTYNFNLPTSAGTSGQPLLSGGGGAGVMTFGTLGATAGGTGLTSFTTGDTLYASASNTLSALPIGSTGQVLTVSGGIPAWAAAPTANTSSLQQNLGLSTSVGSNALTINLKQADGSTDPSSGTSAVTIAFRGSTSSSGNYNLRTVTSSLSITVPSGASLGQTSAVNQYVWVYALDNAGTVELAVSGVKLFDDYSVQSSTTIGAGSTSATTLYSTTGRSNVPIRLIGRLLSNQTTAGTWATGMSEVSLAWGKQPPTIWDWTSFTPTGSWNTNTTYTGYYRRVGDSVECHVQLALTGAPNAATLSVNLPSGLSIDSNKVTSNADTNIQPFGYASVLDGGVQLYDASVFSNNSTSVKPRFMNRDTSPAVISANITNVSPIGFGNTDAVVLHFSVPVTGWSVYGP